MQDIIKNLHQSCRSGSNFEGKQKFPSGKTLEETLTVDGLSLWNVISPTLSINYVSKCLAGEKVSPFILQRISLSKHKLKAMAFDMILPFIGNNNGCIKWPNEPVFLFLGFSQYIYREVLQPIAVRMSNGEDIKAISLHDSLQNKKYNTSIQKNEFQSIWQHLGHDVRLKTVLLQKKFNSILFEIKSSNNLAQIIKDQDTPLWAQMENIFNWLFEAFIPRMLPQIAIARHIFEKHCPALIISPDVNDPRIRIYCLLAQQFKISTLEVQFGGFYDFRWY